MYEMYIKMLCKPKFLPPPLNYSLLGNPMCMHEAHVNKLVCFPLVSLSFVGLIYEGPANEPTTGGWKIVFTPVRFLSIKRCVS